MDADKLVDALAGVIMAPVRHPGLYDLAHPMYLRELRVHQTDSGLGVDVDKFGYSRYKRNRRYQKPTPPPTVNTTAIRSALNDVLPDGIRVTAVIDCGTYVTILF